jgi:transposase
MNALKGDQHAQATLTEDEILAVFRRIENGAFKDMKEVQSALNTTRGIVYSVVAGRSWSHLHRSDKLKQQVAKMQRDVLAHETQQAIIKDLMAGMNRNDVKAKYDLSDSKIAFYVTKVNKMKTST